MKTKKQLAEFILDMFRQSKCDVGHIVMMRVFRNKVTDHLNPKEREIIVDIANILIENGYMTYEDSTSGIECIRLTQKGYDYIYSDFQQIDGINGPELINVEKENLYKLDNTPTKVDIQLNNHIPMLNKPIYKIFVSSTYEDLIEERLKVMSTIVQSGHLPIGMEQFPAAPIDAFEYIKMLIDNSDYYLLLLAGKYGSIYPSTGKSFTQMEYEYAVAKGIPVIFLTYENVDELPLKKSEGNDETKKLLEAFRKQAGTSVLRQTWKSIDELAYKVKDSIEKTIELMPRIGWVRADSINIETSNNLDIDLDETFHFEAIVNPFEESVSKDITITLKNLILKIGSVLKEYAQIYHIMDVVKTIASIDYNDLNYIIERLLYLKIIERGEINNEYEGLYKVWSFTNAGLDLYIKLRNEESQQSAL